MRQKLQKLGNFIFIIKFKIWWSLKVYEFFWKKYYLMEKVLQLTGIFIRLSYISNNSEQLNRDGFHSGWRFFNSYCSCYYSYWTYNFIIFVHTMITNVLKNIWFFSWTHHKYSKSRIFFARILRVSCNLYPYSESAAHGCSNQYMYSPEKFFLSPVALTIVVDNITVTRTVASCRDTQKDSFLFYFDIE